MFTKKIHDAWGYYDFGYKCVTYDKRLRDMPYASAGVSFRKNGDIVLVSYTTDVVIISADGWLRCTGTYSATTRKHIGCFMREYANSYYQLAKQCYEENLEYNVFTGEVRPICA